MGDAAAASPQAAPRKRRRGDGMRRVAEIVMVLAAAGEVRGGRAPTAAERALAAEARERLAAAVAEGAARPRDLFPGEAVRALVEDLGLNRARDPAAMGFRPPRASIADRLLLTKRKMEEVKEPPVQQATITPQTTVSTGMAEFQGSHGAPMFAGGSLRTSPAVAALPTTAPATSNSVMALRQHGSSPIKPVTNPSVVAVSHTAQPHVKLERGVNGPLNLTRATPGHLNKSLHDTSARPNLNAAPSTNQIIKSQDTKVATIQAATGNPVMGHHATQGTASVTAKPTFANHNAIAKNVQHVLQQPANHPSWTPPSTEYMHARLDCQICKVAIMDANSLLVCDACERGAHLKCLQHYGNKGVPTADWHCPTCVAQSKGKPLPPKYGKVTRTVVASQAGPPGGGTQFSVQGAGENMIAKENQQKGATNGNLTKPNSMQASSTVHNSTVLALSAPTDRSQAQIHSICEPAKGTASNAETSSNEMEWNEQPCSSTGCELTAGSSFGTPSGKSPDEKVSSALSLHSVDSANDNAHGQQPTVTSRINCSDSSFVVAAEAKVKLEAQSEALPSGDVEMAANNGTPVDQVIHGATEENIRTQATSAPNADNVDITNNMETPVDQGSNVVAGEKVHTEADSETHAMEDVEMTTSTGTPIGQSNNTAKEVELQTDTTSQPHVIKDMEVTASPATGVDQKSNNGSEEKPWSEQICAVKDVQMTTDAIANGLVENGVTEPLSVEADADNSDFSAMPDHHNNHQVILNGVVRVKDEVLCSQDGELEGCTAAPKEETD
ncbi:PHD finger protein At3g20280-like [Lolium rigidum]|uniref:PHD finger protein At3g20280-like n=1 Tax=Lolium rigidum TaxID=89674 RepID=UPI001F5CAAFB|nr:PHD finger protein At3g20280-like [Lolium rigidum]